MYAIEIGRKFLQLYNEQQRTAKGQAPYTPREFFDEVYYPLFFDVEEDEKQLLSVTNSAFTNAAFKGKAPRLKRFEEQLIEQNERPFQWGGNLFLGGKANDSGDTTSGQSTSITFSFSSDEAILSWIGGGFGIGLEGGYNILITNPGILFFLFAGWQYYRKFLQSNTMVKGRQMETWNGLWLKYNYGKAANEELALTQIATHLRQKSDSVLELGERPSWWDLCTTLAAEEFNMVYGYIYKFGSMNSTCGYLHFNLEPVRRLHEVWQRLFGLDNNPYAIQSLAKQYQTDFGLLDAVEQGGISLTLMRPAQIKKIIGAKGPSKDKEQEFEFQLKTVKTWFIAMLNNDQIADMARNLGQLLRDYEKDSRLNKQKVVEDFLSAKSKAEFINLANDIMADMAAQNPLSEEKAKVLYDAVQSVHRHIPADGFGIFKGLTKTEFIFSKHYQSNL